MCSELRGGVVVSKKRAQFVRLREEMKINKSSGGVGAVLELSDANLFFSLAACSVESGQENAQATKEHETKFSLRCRHDWWNGGQFFSKRLLLRECDLKQ